MLCFRNNARVFGTISLAKTPCSPSPNWRGNCRAQHLGKGQIMLQAILFDLDETLTDRTRSICHYAKQFRSDFAGHLASTAGSTIADAILCADVRGYRPREETWRDFSQRLPW